MLLGVLYLIFSSVIGGIILERPLIMLISDQLALNSTGTELGKNVKVEKVQKIKNKNNFKNCKCGKNKKCKIM